jgi:hypothetical protein
MVAVDFRQHVIGMVKGKRFMKVIRRKRKLGGHGGRANVLRCAEIELLGRMLQVSTADKGDELGQRDPV